MPIKIKQNAIPLLHTLLILLLASCSGKQTLRGVFSKSEPPYERYVAKLQESKLDETALGQEWLAAGQKALQDSITITLPFKETGYFPPEKPKALGYRVAAKRGERIVVNLEMRAREPGQVFLDLFEAAGPNAERVAYADTAATSLQYEVEGDRQHILRLQPELLRGGQYTVTIKAEPTLSFPVDGKTSRHIASIWGDPRDGGARRHEGVDIFAKRGTPALAATAGLVSRVQTTPRGGKVVWLTDAAHGQSLYYAHLDSQLVAAGQRVQAGDTLGLIGNTGNAITTNPHLHFGIYRFGRGATNPYPYLHTSTEQAPDVQINPAFVGNWVRITSKAANIRRQPSTKSTVYASLPRHTTLQVTGGVADWYRVALPNGTEAYIAGNLVEATTKPIALEKVTTETDLLAEAHPQAASKDTLPTGSTLAVLGKYEGYKLVRLESGETGWVSDRESARR
ncbi:peptidoglycan DD-metalloendopeptidase family protein [Pontibacter sp. CAU 1760]